MNEPDPKELRLLLAWLIVNPDYTVSLRWDSQTVSIEMVTRRAASYTKNRVAMYRVSLHEPPVMDGQLLLQAQKDQIILEMGAEAVAHAKDHKTND